MRRFNSLRFRPAALPLLVMLWSLIVPGQAAGSDMSTEPVAGSHAAGAYPLGYVPYLSVGMGVTRSEDTRFADGADAGHAALYGSEDMFDAGTTGNGLHVRLAAGVRASSGFRAQLEASLARSLDYRGNTNYQNSGIRQPSEADLDTWQLLLAGLYEFPGWDLAPGRVLRPFVGVGVGLTGYRLDGYVQRFPDPDDPNGYLRRGPGSEIPFTALPGGSGQNLTWMLTAGVAIPVREGIHLDLSYRYADAGEIRTDTGDITIVRYREDGTRREIQVPINETSADFRTHSLLLMLRFDF